MNSVQAGTRMLRRHAVGLLALFVALGGSSYAAVSAGHGAGRDSGAYLADAAPASVPSTVASIRVCAARRSGALRMVAAHARCRHGERALTLGVVGPSGAMGVPGATGPVGPAGPVGQPGPAVGPAGGALTGNYPNPGIAPGAVGTAQLAPGAVGPSQLAVGAVGPSQLAGAAVQPKAFGTLPAAGTDIYPYDCVAGACSRTAPSGTEFTPCFAQAISFVNVPETTFDTTGTIRQPGAACAGTGLTGTGVSALRAPDTGTYVISAMIAWSAQSTAGDRHIKLTDTTTNDDLAVSEVQPVTESGHFTQQNIDAIVRLPEGDQVSLKILQDSGMTLDLEAGRFEMAWIGP